MFNYNKSSKVGTTYLCGYQMFYSASSRHEAYLIHKQMIKSISQIRD